MPSYPRLALAASAAALSVVLACAGGTRLGSPTDYQMWVHFREAGAIQSALIRGDLPDARDAARSLADAPRAEGIGPSGDAHVRELSAWAREIRDAPSFGDAAVAAGHLAATCGECHEDASGGPVFLEGEPPDDRGFTGHMILHSWAADRMWEGILAPSAVSWREGAEVFQEEPLSAPAVPASARVFAQRLHELGQEAVGLTSLRQKAVQYGRMLEQCAGCHAEMGVTRRPGAPPARPVPTGR